MKADSSKKKTDTATVSTPVNHPSQPHSTTSETATSKTNIIPINTFSTPSSNVNILDQIMNGMSQSQMSKKDWNVKRVNLFLELHKPKAPFCIEECKFFSCNFLEPPQIFRSNLSEVHWISCIMVSVFVEWWTSPVQVYIVLICYWFLIIGSSVGLKLLKIWLLLKQGNIIRKLIFSSLPRIDIPKEACLGWGVNDASGFYKSQFLMVLLPHRSHIYYMVMFWLTMTFWIKWN